MFCKERAKKQKERERQDAAQGSASFCSWLKPGSNRDQEWEKENEDDPWATPQGQISQALSEEFTEHREQDEATDDSELRKMDYTDLQKDEQDAVNVAIPYANSVSLNKSKTNFWQNWNCFTQHIQASKVGLGRY